VKRDSIIKHTETTVLKDLNPEPTYNLPSNAYDKSRDRNM